MPRGPVRLFKNPLFVLWADPAPLRLVGFFRTDSPVPLVRMFLGTCRSHPKADGNSLRIRPMLRLEMGKESVPFDQSVKRIAIISAICVPKTNLLQTMAQT